MDKKVESVRSGVSATTMISLGISPRAGSVCDPKEVLR